MDAKLVQSSFDLLTINHGASAGTDKEERDILLNPENFMISYNAKYKVFPVVDMQLYVVLCITARRV